MSKVVIALGGNALGNTPTEQKEALKTTAKSIVDLHASGNQVIVCHGNGPQVGMILNSFSTAYKNNEIKEPISLVNAGSMSQGYIGIDLQNAIYNELNKRSVKGNVTTLVTQVIVDKNDDSFKNPTKPIGPFYSEDEAKKLASENNWTVKEDAGRGWRRVVASPKPLEIVQSKVVSDLLTNKDNIIIVGGGGGIPGYIENTQFNAVDAVIDKDFTAAKIAEQVSADNFIILTAVDKIMINYGTPEQEALSEVQVDELQKLVDEKMFAEGSMKPKVEAVIQFTKNTDKSSYIADLKFADFVLSGENGTKIFK